MILANSVFGIGAPDGSATFCYTQFRNLRTPPSYPPPTLPSAASERELTRTICDSREPTLGLRQLGLEPVPLGAKSIDLVEHPLEKRFRGRGGHASPPKLEDFLALAANLHTHVLDFRADSSSPMTEDFDH